MKDDKETVQAHMRKILDDFRALYHEHGSMLQRITQRLAPTLEHFGEDPTAIRSLPTRDEIRVAFREPVQALDDALVTLIAEVRRVTGRVSAPEKNLERRRKVLRDLARVDDPLLMPTGLRQLVKALRRNMTLARRQFRSISTAACDEVDAACDALLRQVCIHDLKTIVVQVQGFDRKAVTMQTQLNALAKNSSTTTGPQVGLSRVSIVQLVEQARTHNQPAADAKRLDFRIKTAQSAKDAKVSVVRPDVLRALNAILDNAVKYNATLKAPNKAWIKVDISAKDGKLAVDVESWGVPITREELADDLVFEKGYRGQYAGINGSGYGLSYARGVARTHGGDVVILHSKPARRGARADDYAQEFLTSVRLSLPIR